MYDRTVKIWTILEEDERIYQLEQREEKLNIAVWDLRLWKKTMAISLRLRRLQKMKNI
jgi:hypothetical protein